MSKNSMMMINRDDQGLLAYALNRLLIDMNGGGVESGYTRGDVDQALLNVHEAPGTWPRCSPECEGWDWFDTPFGREIERCDDCDRFADDDEALAYVKDLMAKIADMTKYERS